MQVPYASILFSIYDGKISEMCEPFITQVCTNMRPINFKGDGKFDSDDDRDPLAMGTSLFELYIEIQKFAEYDFIQYYILPATTFVVRVYYIGTFDSFVAFSTVLDWDTTTAT